MSERTPAAVLSAVGLLAGATAGAATGAIDALWTWSALGQFLPGFGDKLRFAVFLAACYALAGALVGALAAAVWSFYRDTRLGDLASAALAHHRAARAHDPRDALAGLALALACVPAIGAALALAFVLATAALAWRKHLGLVIAAAMGAGLLAIAVGALLGFALARPVEAGLRRLARGDRTARVLSDVRTPAAVALGLLAVGAAVAGAATWSTLALLDLRPFAVALLAAALAAPAIGIGRRLGARLDRRSPALRRAAYPGAVIALAALVVVAGGPEGVRKASNAYSGLGAPLTRGFRALVDFDRDGYSRILGGGDCDDWDPDVHPGATEIPDDGVDQNCVGGDASTRRDATDVGFVPVPASVPHNLNVVLITIDTVRADHFGSYGYERPTTPRMDAVAAEGGVFVNGWAHAPSTRYSIPAILTGRYPLAVRYDFSIRGWPGLLPSNTTIAETMKRAGMTTGAILNYWYFDRKRGMDQGFDHYDNENKRLHRRVPGQGPGETSGSSARQQTDKAIEFVRQRAADRFFLWVHYYDPHFRYEKHPEVTDFGDGRIDRYDNEILFTDLHIGRLFDELARVGAYDRTAIVITGDHGEGFGEHGIDLHGYHLYAAQTKVPLIVRVPGLAPVRATMPASHIDILPTLANLVGLAPDPDMMGRSLLGALSGQADPHADRWVFQQLSYEGEHEHHGVASQRCHVLYNVSPDTSWELYRIDIDPLEARDVIDTPGPCAGARGVLERWYDQSEIPAGAAEALLDGPPAIARPLGVRFDEMILLAVDLPREAKRGRAFEVEYTFAANGPLRGGWRVFAHFEQVSGDRTPGRRAGRFQADHSPARPFAWWREGQYIRYRRTVTVPRSAPAGTYALWTGIFRGARRKPVRAAGDGVTVVDDRVEVGRVRVR